MSTPQLFLNTDWNVGVGTATPAVKLDVVGWVNISWNLWLNIQQISCTNWAACDIDSSAQSVVVNCPTWYVPTWCSPACYDTNYVRFCQARTSTNSCGTFCQWPSWVACNGAIYVYATCMRISDIWDN